MIKKYLLATAFILSIASPALAQSDGTLTTLNPWISTTSPVTSITQRVFGRPLYITGLNFSECVEVSATGLLTTSGAPCGSGGGGSSGGTWSTTTSSVASQLVNYPNNASDVVVIGSNSTTTSEFWFDPNNTFSYIKGYLGIGTTSPYARLSVAGEVVGQNFTATSTTLASTLPYASSTALTISGTAYIGSLNGPLQANGGTVSATSTIGVRYGGTGLTTDPTYGLIPVGNGTGYTLTATSSLGLAFSDITGVLGIANGGTNASALNATQLLYFDGTRIAGTSTPTASYFIATSTSLASVFPYASTTALSVSGNAYFPSSGIWNSSGNVGIGTTTPGTRLGVNGAGVFTGDVTAPRYVATSTASDNRSVFTNASTTGALSASVFCLASDGCRTTWPTSGGGSWPFTQDSYAGVATQSTTSPLWLKATSPFSLIATSTFVTQASSTQLTNSGNTWLPTLTSAIIQAGSDGLLAEYAGTSCTNQFVRSLSALGIATCATVSLTADVTGVLPLANGGTNASALNSTQLLYNDGTRIAGTSTPTASYFVATSTTHRNVFPYASTTALTVAGSGSALNVSSASATSTFAGGLTSNMVGVGTSTPSALLQLFSTASTTLSVDSNSSSRGGCIQIKDLDGSGYTYVYANNGVIYSSTISCK